MPTPSPAQESSRSSTLPVVIIIADDDDEDRDMALRAFSECRLANNVQFMINGEELLDYLHSRGTFSGRAPGNPSLILLDLKMPKKDGYTVLRELKADPALRHIPVVVLTTSSAEEDVIKSYALGVNSFITKPVTFAGLVQAMQTLSRYWFEIVELPHDRRSL